MTFEEFLNKVDKVYYENEFELRYGQALMNVLHQVWPDWYSRITGTDFDCYYDDGIAQYTLDYLEAEWNDKQL
jgi:hypothetical protein